MAIFYFKKSFILALCLLILQVASAQTFSTETPVASNEVETPAASNGVDTPEASNAAAKPKREAKKPISLKFDSEGRAFYIDQQDDYVIVLDYKTRSKVQALSSPKKEAPLTDLNTKNFYKETVPDITEVKKLKFETYKTKEGDTWESISQKLYNTEGQWAQLKLWNEELLKDVKIPEGSKVKYMELPKK